MTESAMSTNRGVSKVYEDHEEAGLEVGATAKHRWRSLRDI